MCVYREWGQTRIPVGLMGTQEGVGTGRYTRAWDTVGLEVRLGHKDGGHYSRVVGRGKREVRSALLGGS